jgi:Homeodomain-like domain
VANQLKMAIVQSILSLHAQGWSGRRIAAALEVNRETVSRYLRQQQAGDSNPANAPISPAGSAADSNPANAPISPAGSGRTSHCLAWREFILTRRAQGLSAKRIHQDLAAEPGAAAISYDSVRRYLKRQATTRPIPFRRMQCAAGQEAQVDFGSGARPTSFGSCSVTVARRTAKRPLRRRLKILCAAWRMRSPTSAACLRRSSSTISKPPWRMPIGSTQSSTPSCNRSLSTTAR